MVHFIRTLFQLCRLFAHLEAARRIFADKRWCWNNLNFAPKRETAHVKMLWRTERQKQPSENRKHLRNTDVAKLSLSHSSKSVSLAQQCKKWWTCPNHLDLPPSPLQSQLDFFFLLRICCRIWWWSFSNHFFSVGWLHPPPMCKSTKCRQIDRHRYRKRLQQPRGQARSASTIVYWLLVEATVRELLKLLRTCTFLVTIVATWSHRSYLSQWKDVGERLRVWAFITSCSTKSVKPAPAWLGKQCFFVGIHPKWPLLFDGGFFSHCNLLLSSTVSLGNK